MYDSKLKISISSDGERRNKRHWLTCVTPASNVTVTGLFDYSLFSHGQTGRKNMAAEWHTLPWHLIHCPWWQMNQGQVVIIAMGVVTRMKHNLINAILLFIFLGDKGVVVAHSDFILLSAVSIPAKRNSGIDPKRPFEKEGVCAWAIPQLLHKSWAINRLALAKDMSAIVYLKLQQVQTCFTES